MSENEQQAEHTHTVRSRWAWIGLLVLLAGLVTAGVGIALPSMVTIIVGAAVVVVGAASAVYGGLFYDIRPRSGPGQIVHDVIQGDAHEALGPDSRYDTPRTRRDSEQTSKVVQRVQARSQGYPRPSVAPIGTWLLIAVAVWLFVAQAAYPNTLTGKNTGLRDIGLGLLLALSAFTLRTRLPPLPAIVVCALVGVALVVFSFVLGHGSTPTMLSELVSGVLVLVGVLMQLDRIPRATAPGQAAR